MQTIIQLFTVYYQGVRKNPDGTHRVRGGGVVIYIFKNVFLLLFPLSPYITYMPIA
jgi:hypothetical protein